VWDCDDVDEASLMRSPSDEDITGPLDSELVSSDRECDLKQGVATPTSDATFSADGERTPLFSSNLPINSDPEDLERQGSGDEMVPGNDLMHATHDAL
jgi:hypothetical protein